MQVPINQPQYLFSYGILCQKAHQQAYGLTEVEEYVTLQGHKTQTAYSTSEPGISWDILYMVPSDDLADTVSGVLLEVPHDYDWTRLDQLEAAYDRVMVDRMDGAPVYAYIEKTTKGEQ